MPRLPTRLLWRAHIKNPLYPLLLQKCRTFQLGYKEELRCVHNEFMWLNELAEMTLRTKLGDRKDVPERVKQRCVAKLAKRMVRGQPLPQVMDSQPFGDLNIECPKGAFSPQYVELCIRLKTRRVEKNKPNAIYQKMYRSINESSRSPHNDRDARI